MVINHRQKFVFIHVPKVAGTSIQNFLMDMDGSEKNPFSKTKHLTYKEFILKCKFRMRWDIINYKYFAFVRNPWDRFSSLHRYLVKEHSHRFPVPGSVNEMAEALEDREPWIEGLYSIKPQSEFIEKNFFFIGRYEKIERDFNYLKKKLFLPDIELNRFNGTSNNNIDYRVYYNDRAASIIEKNI